MDAANEAEAQAWWDTLDYDCREEWHVAVEFNRVPDQLANSLPDRLRAKWLHSWPWTLMGYIPGPSKGEWRPKPAFKDFVDRQPREPW